MRIKSININKILKAILITAAIFAAQSSFAQASVSEIAAAPNLPEMVRFDDIGKSFLRK